MTSRYAFGARGRRARDCPRSLGLPFCVLSQPTDILRVVNKAIGVTSENVPVDPDATFGQLRGKDTIDFIASADKCRNFELMLVVTRAAMLRQYMFLRQQQQREQYRAVGIEIKKKELLTQAKAL